MLYLVQHLAVFAFGTIQSGCVIALSTAALTISRVHIFVYLFQVVVLVLDGSEGMLRKTELSIASMGTSAA